MQLGMIGLGRMGASLVRRLTKDGHKCVVYDVSAAAVKKLADRGIRGAASIDERPGAEAPYERLLGDAMAGNGALFTREDAVEAAWAVVDPVLTKHHRVKPYKRGSWGPKEADALIAADGSWYNPRIADAASD